MMLKNMSKIDVTLEKYTGMIPQNKFRKETKKDQMFIAQLSNYKHILKCTQKLCLYDFLTQTKYIYIALKTK